MTILIKDPKHFNDIFEQSTKVKEGSEEESNLVLRAINNPLSRVVLNKYEDGFYIQLVDESYTEDDCVSVSPKTINRLLTENRIVPFECSFEDEEFTYYISAGDANHIETFQNLIRHWLSESEHARKT